MRFWVTKHIVFDVLNTSLKGNLFFYLRMLKLLKLQKFLPYKTYEDNYFYQGYEVFGIRGAKPTIFRLNQYSDLELPPKSKILDIGSNVGFLDLHLSSLGFNVTGIEINPVLVTAANCFKAKIGANTNFICSDFLEYNFKDRFEVVLSLSNHQTTDGNLKIDFNAYIAKVHSLLKTNGIFVFESHNIYGPGKGLPGDDGDILEKITLLTRYFRIYKFKMVKSYLEHNVNDVNKLLVVMYKIDFQSPNMQLVHLNNFYSNNFDYSYIKK